VLGLVLLVGCGSASKVRRNEEAPPDKDGPLAEVVLPVVVGLTESKAVAKLAAVDLIAIVEHVKNKTVPAGRVFEQDPVAGNGEDPDAHILVIVSTG
jgi:hypothetical protein